MDIFRLTGGEATAAPSRSTRRQTRAAVARSLEKAG